MRSDNAPDLVQGQAANVAEERTIIFELTPPRTPASNTVAESSVNKCKNGIASAMVVAPHMPTCTLSGALTYFCRVHELLAPSFTKWRLRDGSACIYHCFLLCATIFFRSKTPLFLSLRIAEFIFLSQTFRFEAELQGGVAQSMASLD